ncbi:MAG: LysM peptidoglycan-binding domain-containing protein [Treponema sp.]|nr:LysM peptidoglycan-binding domain-containing protein [Treponema sp.]
MILFFLSTAAISVYLFRADLMQTIEARDEEPAGTIIIRNNIVQRRYADRVIWERLFVDSPVYSGDLIRASDLSGATIHLDKNQISVNENTLIRIRHSLVELTEGNLSVATGEGAGIMLSLMGRQVQLESGTVLNAELGKEGIVVMVNDGAATFVEEGQTRELVAGMLVAQDPSGAERIIPAAVVTSFGSNERYLKNAPEPLSLDFKWNNINIEKGETVRLEIAGNRGFTKDVRVIERVIEGPDSYAQADFEAGLWYWRIAYGDSILSTGQIAVAEAARTELLSPVANSVFRYHSDLPQLRFQWSQSGEASHYILEVSATPGFENTAISRQVSALYCIQSGLGQGTWYWRVLPVFPPAFKGTAVYSPVSSFRIEQTADPLAPAFELPPPARRTYTVQQDDTLSKIARAVYGDSSLWRRIAEANDIGENLLIFPDQVLLIP